MQFTLPNIADSIRLVHSFGSNIFNLSLVWVSISQKLLVLDLIFFIPICFDEGLQFLVTHSHQEVSQDLSKLFWRYFEVLMIVEVLEETLGIQPGPQQQFSDSCYYVI